MKKILIIDPSTGGGIRQGSVYLYEYLSKRYKTRFTSIGEVSNEYFLFKHYEKVIRDWAPDLVIAHDFVNTKFLNYIKVLHPSVRFAYFSLGKTSFGDNRIGIFDYFITPYSKKIQLFSEDNSKTKQVKWMFDLPERFWNKNLDSNVNKNLLFVGRVIEPKLNMSFLNNLGSETTVDIVGDLDDYSEYIEQVKKKTNVIIKNSELNGKIHEVYKKYTFFVLPTDSETFSLASLEATYGGCIPLVTSKEEELPWSSKLTYRILDVKDIINLHKTLSSLSPVSLKNYAEEHRKSVKNKIVELSSFRIIDDILNSPASNRNIFKQNSESRLGEDILF